MAFLKRRLRSVRRFIGTVVPDFGPDDDDASDHAADPTAQLGAGATTM